MSRFLVVEVLEDKSAEAVGQRSSSKTNQKVQTCVDTRDTPLQFAGVGREDMEGIVGAANEACAHESSEAG